MKKTSKGSFEKDKQAANRITSLEQNSYWPALLGRIELLKDDSSATIDVRPGDYALDSHSASNSKCWRKIRRFISSRSVRAGRFISVGSK